MTTMPVLFIGHGSPMNAVDDNPYTRSLNRWGQQLQKFQPKAILSISAHWWVPGSFVTGSEHPELIYDFGGFPQELYELKYPCLGSNALAHRIQSLDKNIKIDDHRGLDHGVWSPLLKLFPKAETPVLQMSIDRNLNSEQIWQLGEKLKPLRQDGVLIFATGNIVHSFAGFRGAPDAKPYDWALEFDEKIKQAIVKKDKKTLLNYLEIGPSAKLAVPTPEHYLPLLYAMALADVNDAISFPYEGFDYASFSMRCVQIG